MTQEKKLYRNIHNKVIGGVSGGLAEYFDVDVVVFRLLFVLLVLFGGGGVLAYIVMWIVIPPKPEQYFSQPTSEETTSGNENPHDKPENNPETVTSAPAPQTKQTKEASNTSLLAGIILIFIGVLFLFHRVMPWVNLANFWPVLLIIGGFLIIDPSILKSSKNKRS